MNINLARPPFNATILFYVVFLPLLGRNFFPIVRDKDSISFVSSFTDPQMIATYILAMYLIYTLLRFPGALAQTMRAPLLLFTLLVLVCFVSVAISSFPLLTAWRSFEITLVLIWAAMILTMPEEYIDSRSLFKRFYSISVLMMIAVVIGIFIDPQSAWHREAHVDRLTGSSTFMMGPNELGVMAAILSVAALSRYLIFSKARYLIAAVFAAILCYLAGSRAGFIVFIGNILIMFAMLVRIPDKSTAVFILSSFGLVILAGLLAISPEFTNWVTFTFTRGHDQENLATLDGRTELWEAGWRAFQQSPLLGYGYSVYPKYTIGGHFHNLFIEVLVTTGIVGMVPVLMLMMWLMRNLTMVFFVFPYIDPHERTVYVDAIIIAVGIFVANMATSAVTHYSWDLIAVSLILIALKRIKLRLASELIDDTSHVDAKSLNIHSKIS